MARVFVVLGLIAFATAAHAGPISYTGGTYNQQFDTLGTSSSPTLWTNGTTLQGWYAIRENNNTVSSYRGSNGTVTNTNDLYSYGATGVAERALGSQANGAGSTNVVLHYGVQFINNTGSALNSLSISFTGEQWRRGGTGLAETLFFAYSVKPSAEGATGLTTGTYLSYAPLNFVTPNFAGGPAALNGNDVTNQTSKTAVIPVVWGAGETLWLRWRDPDDPGLCCTNSALAIDNFSFSAAQVPDAGSSSLLLSIGFSVLALLRRRIQ